MYKISRFIEIMFLRVPFKFVVLENESLPCLFLEDEPPIFPRLKRGALLSFSKRQGDSILFKSCDSGRLYRIKFLDPEIWSFAIAILYERLSRDRDGSVEFLVEEETIDYIKDSEPWHHEKRELYAGVSHNEAWLYAFCMSKFIAKQGRVKEIPSSFRSHRYFYYELKGTLYNSDNIEMHYDVQEHKNNKMAMVYSGEIERHTRLYSIKRRRHYTNLKIFDFTEAESEKEQYVAGDPRLLRDSSNGQFGSYPSFEGDDEEE